MNKFIRFFVGCLLLITLVVVEAKAEMVQAKEAEDSIVFYPQEGKTLIAVGVVYNKKNASERLVAFEQALQAAGWQRQRSGDYYGTPGNCIIDLRADQYAVDCYLERKHDGHTLHLRTKSIKVAVAQAEIFSRLLRVPQSQRIRIKKVRTIQL